MARVFVYGTLKLGNRLNSALSNDTFLCHTKTIDRNLDLIGGSSFPWAVRLDHTGHRLGGDLYEVSEQTLERLDQIEGVPLMYKRDTVMVERDNGIEEEAFIYVAADGINRGNIVGVSIDTDGCKNWRQT